ncbi:MAG: hypothetical protein GY928_32150 [Colwellia sp.]|nr:hypothetical protein [Colwellia sp.]
MHINLQITTSEEYFNETDRQIDRDDDDNTKIPYKQADALQKILAAEVSIHLLRRTTGICGSLVDNIVEVRRHLINEYEQTYEPYKEYRDFY